MDLLIPALALCIPIVAILAKTYTKTRNTAANTESSAMKDALSRFENQIEALKKDNLRLEEALKELEDKQDFLTKLIEDKNR